MNKAFSKEKGVKYDQGKRMWCLMPWRELDSVVDVLTFGAKKYSPDNWKKVDVEKYKSAVMRHLSAWFQGNKVDEEDGASHLAHAICNLLFLMWFDNNIKRGKNA